MSAINFGSVKQEDFDEECIFPGYLSDDELYGNLVKTRMMYNTPATFCAKCGNHKHETKDCPLSPQQIIEHAESSMNKINILRKNIVNKYVSQNKLQRDQFGYIENIITNRYEAYSWENSKFCSTCGEKGHLWNECKYKPFGMIAKEVVQELDEENGIKSYHVDEKTYKEHFVPDENWSKPDDSK